MKKLLIALVILTGLAIAQAPSQVQVTAINYNLLRSVVPGLPASSSPYIFAFISDIGSGAVLYRVTLTYGTNKQVVMVDPWDGGLTVASFNATTTESIKITVEALTKVATAEVTQ